MLRVGEHDVAHGFWMGAVSLPRDEMMDACDGMEWLSK